MIRYVGRCPDRCSDYHRARMRALLLRTNATADASSACCCNVIVAGGGGSSAMHLARFTGMPMVSNASVKNCKLAALLLAISSLDSPTLGVVFRLTSPV